MVEKDAEPVPSNTSKKPPRKLGEILADMVLYGDIEEAPIPNGMTSLPELKDDVEAYVRVSIAATLLKLTNGGEGGSCSVDDESRSLTCQRLPARP